LREALPRGIRIATLSPEALDEFRAKAKDKGIELPDWNIDTENDLIIDLPTWRLDVEREIDLIEEIARIYGYNKFANTLPSFSGGVVELPNSGKFAKLRALLLSLGYNEAMSSTFISSAEAGAFSGAMMVPLANPLSEEQSVMRNSLVPGMLSMLAWNLNRGESDARLFEMGHVFSAPSEEATEETPMLCIGATGNAVSPSVHGSARPYSLFDLKGDVETLLGAFEIDNLCFEKSGHYHPGRSARAVVSGVTLAEFEQIHPDVAAARKLKQEIYIAQVHLDRLLALPLRTPRYQPLSKFPAIDRDFSFLFADSVSYEQIESAVCQLQIAELRRIQPVEIFRGGAVPAGKYSALLRVQFQSMEHTLRDDEVAQWSAQIIKALEAVGGSLRAQ
jgi:phenylalanyl-tRNA synthetase beta chain